MQTTILQSLDDLTSTHATWAAQDEALNSLEHLLARILLPHPHESEMDKERLLELQDLFEYNMPVRIMPWMAGHLKDLNKKKSCYDEPPRTELASLLVRAMCLLQGLSLLHTSSKEFLGRRNSIEILLDILSVTRQTSKPLANSTNSNNEEPTVSRTNAALAFAALDTFLCILADSPPALRTFEKAEGLEAIVKLLRRNSIPKEVRMKCLELLYLYLMDETSTTKSPDFASSPLETLHCPRPSEASPAKASSGSHAMFASSALSSTFSPTPTLITSTSSRTPPQSPTKIRKRPDSLHKSFGMLRKDVDYVPLSPTKPHLAETPVDGLPRMGAFPEASTVIYDYRIYGDIFSHSKLMSPDPRRGVDGCRLRTIEEKKEVLGRLLGNVDALVEGVKSAGIWGLGS